MIMERNGDVATEFNSCNPEHFQLSTDTFKRNCDKMCKDDNSESLFCNMSGKIRSENIMASGFETRNEISISEFKNQCLENLNKTQSGLVDNDEDMLSIIQKQSEVVHKLLPMWNKDNELYNFPASTKTPISFLSEDSFMHNDEIQNAAENSFSIDDNCPNTIFISDSSLETTSDSLQHNGGEDSSSSIEEIFCPDLDKLPAKKCCVQIKSENDSLKKDPWNLEKQNRSPARCDPSCLGIPKLDLKEEAVDFSPKNDRAMPQLIPTICLDDDDDVDFVPLQEKKSCEVANAADSPEMPKLVPFSTDIEEINKIKKASFIACESDQSSSFLLLPVKRNLFSEDPTPLSSPSIEEIFSPKLFNLSETKDFAQNANGDKTCNGEIKNSFSEINSPGRVFQSTIGESRVASGVSLIEESVSNLSVGRDYAGVSLQSNDSWKFEDYNSQKKFFDTSSECKKEWENIRFVNSAKKNESENDSQDSVKVIHQAKTALERLASEFSLALNKSKTLAFGEISAIDDREAESKFSFKNCLPSNDSDDDSLASKPDCQENKNSSSDGPEIEEIEGIRFFQFRSKHAMEEFNKKPPALENSNVEMIVPTKTTDITQIKGWRNKYFASESEIHHSYAKSENNIDDSSQNAVSLPPLKETNNNCLDFHIQADDMKAFPAQEVKSLNNSDCQETDIKSASEICTSTPMKPNSEEKTQVLKTEAKTFEKTKIETKSDSEKKSEPEDPMSAFVSEKLDDFLLNSSKLNITYLQKVNPNTIPIDPEASILRIGKLRKTDRDTSSPFKSKFFYKVKDDQEDQVSAKPSNEQVATRVITVSSSSDTSDDDIPVARLSKKTSQVKPKPNKPLPNKCVKRRLSDSSLDQASQRVVLRLTKQSRGASDGYKVSDISYEKHDSKMSCSSSDSEDEFPGVFTKPTDGTLPIIKDTLFLKENEPKLLEEFLNNLNMYGTSKGVTMLVESNQSYFAKGPELTKDHCREALDNLVFNDEFPNERNKSITKRKIKTWQKYIPKKLTKIQRQCISNGYSQPKSLNASDSKISESVQEKQEKEKAEQNSLSQEKSDLKQKILDKISKSKAKQTKLKPLKNAAKVHKNVKSKHLLTLQQKKEIKRASKMHTDSQLALLERGKRSIRLPARYLDSAVLAAGSEWVSPVFVNDEKKNRKHLLDVLDKITNKENDIRSESVKPENVLNSSDNTVRKNSVEGPGKSLKRLAKGSINSKKQKVDHVKQNTKVTKNVKNQNITADSGKNDKSSTLTDERINTLTSCSCKPCARTVSFEKVKKIFVCISEHNVKQTSIGKVPLQPESVSNNTTGKNSIDITTKVVDEDKAKIKTEQNLAAKNIKPISSDSDLPKKSELVDCSVQKYPVSHPVSVNTSVLQNSLSKSSVIVSNTVSESYRSQSSLQKMISPNTPLQFISPPSKNVPCTAISNKVLLLVPPVMSTPPKVTNCIVSNAISIQNFTSENRSVPSILTRKTVPETSVTPSSVGSQKNVVISALSPTSVSSSFNQTPVLLTLPNEESRSNCLSLNNRPPQVVGTTLTPITNGSDNVSLVSNPYISPPKFPVMKLNLGNKIFLYPPKETKPSPTNIPTFSSSSQNHGSSVVQSSEKLPPFLTTNVKAEASSNFNDTVKEEVLPKSFPCEVTTDKRKQSSEHRRKSPLSERVYKEDSDVEVDVNTVDETFDPVAEMKKDIAVESDSDISDDEVSEIFRSSMPDFILENKTRSINERKRRSVIKHMFEKLKNTTPFFKNARSCHELLDMTTFTVQQQKRLNKANLKAKRMLQLRNSQLIRVLNYTLADIKDPLCRDLVKKESIKVLARDWESRRPNRPLTSSPIKNVTLNRKKEADHKEAIQTHQVTESKRSKDSNAFQSDEDKQQREVFAALPNHNDKKQKMITTAYPNIEDAEKKAIFAQLDIEMEESPELNVEKECVRNFQTMKTPKKGSDSCKQSPKGKVNCDLTKDSQLNGKSSKQSETYSKIEEPCMMETETFEQPHVQLRILEADPNGNNEELEIHVISNANEKPFECEMSNPQKKGQDVLSNPLLQASSPQKNLKDVTSTPLSQKAKRLKRLFRGSSDATSDDERLVIDLSDESPISESKPPIKNKLPGDIPVYKPGFLNSASTFNFSKQNNASCTKSFVENKNQKNSSGLDNQLVITKKTSIAGLMTITPVEYESPELTSDCAKKFRHTDLKTVENLKLAVDVGNSLLMSSEKEKLQLRNGLNSYEPIASLSNRVDSAPRQSLQQSVNSARMPQLKELSSLSSKTANGLKKDIHEEIVIDDSDDDEESSLDRISSFHTAQTVCGVQSINAHEKL
ncbi:hypothetical protein CDAR_528992 [Caerostris darwini]|uniref:BHLH domain-containing protein n=1 Tax=Caerostris darwini TaxID=1538125 RepID=A0AAV4UD24_9ARAC|nr:hypothetical protein CDAR_528992 [Caerostris darwini]